MKSPQDATPLGVLAAICKRPEMYVGNRNFERIALLISGYAWGLAEAGADSVKQLDLVGFRLWLASTLYQSHGLPRNYGWDWYIQQLYPDNEEALRQLPILYEQFLNAQATEVP